MLNLVGQILLYRYQVLEMINCGWVAEVYKVWDQERSVHPAWDQRGRISLGISDRLHGISNDDRRFGYYE
jgi:hypothetical protein